MSELLESDTQNTHKMKFQLGDIVQINAPTDTSLNDHIFFIKYADIKKLVFVDENGNEYTFSIDEKTGILNNSAITNINILSRSLEPGYAKQNNLQIGVWIDIFFNTDVPMVLTGKISDLEEDMVEITTYPENNIIYIDFDYKGIPAELLIEKIVIRPVPADLSLEPPAAPAAPAAPAEPAEEEEAPLEEEAPAAPAETIKSVESEFAINDFQIGETLEEVSQIVDVPENEQRFGLDQQTSDLLDDLISTIPSAKRNQDAVNNIHKLIERFKQLRCDYSFFDKQGNAQLPLPHDSTYKPLVDILADFKEKLYWIMAVAKLNKKIYDNEEDGEEGEEAETDNAFTTSTSLKKEIKAIDAFVENYKSGNIALEGEDENNYKKMLVEIDAFLMPFKTYENENSAFCASEVNTSITAMVNNLENFETQVMASDKKEGDKRPLPAIARKKFYTQTYNTGASYNEIEKVKGSNDLSHKKQITKNETIAFDSLLMLPVETINFSYINLPMTDVLNRAMLNTSFLSYARFLNTKTQYGTVLVDDSEKEQKYEQQTFLSNVKHYQLLDTQNDIIGIKSKQDFKKFLQAVLPNTTFLIDYMRPLLTSTKLSVHNYLGLLEPFMVYNCDLHITHYQRMQELVEKSIVEYKKNYLNMRKFYSSDKITQLLEAYRNPSCLIILERIFAGNEGLLDQIMNLYGFKEKSEYERLTYPELLVLLNQVDNSILFNTAISLLDLNLMIDDSLVEQQIQQMNAYMHADQAPATVDQAPAPADQEQAKEKCESYQNIAKRYYAEDEMAEDNNTDIYFDKQYDPTFYEVAKDMQIDPTAPLEVKIRIVKEKLMKDHKLTERNAERDAKAMLVGKRLVEEGDLALIENTGDNTMTYYQRKNNVWVLNPDINSSTFSDQPKILCNLDASCLNVKNECKTTEVGTKELKMKNLKKVLEEFDAKLQVNKAQMQQKIENALNAASARMKTLREINALALVKYDQKKYLLGNTADAVNTTQSPNAYLRDLILAEEDYAKKQTHIDKFATYFTRQPTKNENPYWLYCIYSDLKLLPIFLVRLANAYLNKTGYQETLNRICKEQGKLSDDGDAWVDKESGYTIRMIDFSTDEEYTEEGFKSSTRAILESDAGEKFMTENQEKGRSGFAAEKERKFESPQAQNVFTVINTLANFMNISIKTRVGFIIKNVIVQLGILVPSEKDYNQMVKEMQNSKTKPDDYQTTYNKSLIILSLCYFLIAVQTSIPSIKTSKTFPGCKKSFTGFPMRLQGGDDRAALKYLVCVVGKLEKKGVKLWSAIAKMKEKDIEKKMESFLTEYILKTDEVDLLRKEKEDYLLHNKETELEPLIPLAHSVKRWVSFLPLLRPVKIQAKQIADVSSDFKEKFLKTMKMGSKEQEEMLAVLQSKIIYMSIGIEERIQQVVGKQMTLLVANGSPILENACCNANSESINPLNYFITEQSEIKTLNENVKRIGNLLEDVKSMSKAGILYDPSRKTLRKLIKPPTNFTEETIYRAAIFYCKYNSTQPVKPDLKEICLEKPANFNANEPIERQIKNLKNNGYNYTNDYLQQLLAIINANNKIEMTIPHAEYNETQKTRLNVLKVLLAPENAAEDERADFKNFRAQFIGILNNFNENGVYSGEANDLRRFKNYLATQNDAMKARIVAFLKENAKQISLKKNEMAKLEECLDTILVFQQISGEKHNAKDEQDGVNTYDRASTFLKNSVRRLTREIPLLVINDVNTTKMAVPKHWNLAKNHQTDLMAKMTAHYHMFNKFIGKPMIKSIMKRTIALTRDLQQLAENTELNTYSIQQIKLGSVDAYDVQLSKFLLKFYLYTILDTIISIKKSDILAVNKETSTASMKFGQKEDEDEEEEEEEDTSEDVEAGKEKKLEEMLAEIVVTFTDLLCSDKKVIDVNYTTLMEKVLRSKEKEKDNITTAFKEMNDDEKQIENIFKDMRLERWSKGLQKGLFVYNKATYEEESVLMEKQKLLDLKRAKRAETSKISIDDEDALNADENEEERIENEDMEIHYAGEAENDDYDDLDGDEYFP